MRAEYCSYCGVDVSEYGIVGGRCPKCQGQEMHFDGIARLGSYEGMLRRMILVFKGGRADMRWVLGGMLSVMMERVSFRREVDTLVPVPMHWIRRIERGYNQSVMLAKQLRWKGVRVVKDLLRIRYTAKQAELKSREARVRNVKGAFTVRRGHPFKGKVVCLVDDIKTSGATLDECARVLKEAGALKVYAVVVAVAGQWG